MANAPLMARAMLLDCFGDGVGFIRGQAMVLQDEFEERDDVDDGLVGVGTCAGRVIRDRDERLPDDADARRSQRAELEFHVLGVVVTQLRIEAADALVDVRA